MIPRFARSISFLLDALRASTLHSRHSARMTPSSSWLCSTRALKGSQLSMRRGSPPPSGA